MEKYFSQFLPIHTDKSSRYYIQNKHKITVSEDTEDRSVRVLETEEHIMVNFLSFHFSHVSEPGS